MNEGARIESLTVHIIGDVRTSLLLLLAAAASLLLIACANIANLLLARATVRAREIAVRQALGAATWRMVRQLTTENLLLAIFGATIGCAIAYGIVALVVQLGPRDLPRIEEIRVDAVALAFALGIGIITGLLFGLAPLSTLRGSANAERLKGAATSTTAHQAPRRLRSALIVSQIAVCGVLLMVASLTVRSLMRLEAVDPGFDPEHAVTFNLAMMEQSYPTGAQMRTFTRRLLDNLRTMPGLESVGLTTNLPFGGNFWVNPATAEGNQESPLLGIRAISPGYFEAMQMRIVRGRLLQNSDIESTEHVAIISESTAKKLFPGTDPIGHHVKLGSPGSRDQWRRVIGVVADVHERALDVPPEPDLYLPYEQLGDPATAMAGRGVNVVMRTNAQPADAIGYARSALAQMDRGVPMHDIGLLRELVSASAAQPRFRTLLFSGFGVLALLLASVGLYGVLI